MSDTSLDFHIDIGEKPPPPPDIKKPKAKNYLRPNLESTHEWIETLGLNPDMIAGLKTIASKHPHSALPHFRKNIQKHIAELQKKLLK